MSLAHLLSDATAPKERTKLLTTCLIALVWCSVAIVIYRPFESHPFDVLDFSEFLPLLRGSDRAFDQLRNLTEYYASRGRLSVIAYAIIVLRYRQWGDNAIGWQLTNAVEIVVVSVLLYVLLRKWGSSALGAVASSVLPLCSQIASPAWVRVVMSEPLALIIILLLFLVATEYASAPRLGLVLWACLLVVVLAFLKEVLLSVLPGVWAVAVVSRDAQEWSWRWPSRPTLVFLLATSVTSVACVIPIAYVALSAPADSYSSLYGSSHLDLGSLVARYIAMIVPFAPVEATPNPGNLLADVTFLLLLWLGWRQYAKSPAHRVHSRWLLAFALTFPLLGAVAYLPWPNFQSFYALPYMLGTAVLVAFAITGLAKERSGAAVLAVALWAGTSSFLMTSAQQYATRTDATLRTVHEVVRDVSSRSKSDSVIFAMRILPPRSWFGLGATLRRQALADGMQFPATTDVQCADAKRLVDEGRYHPPVVVFQTHCAHLGGAPATITSRYQFFDWRRLRVVKDSIRADLYYRS